MDNKLALMLKPKRSKQQGRIPAGRPAHIVAAVGARASGTPVLQTLFLASVVRRVKRVSVADASANLPRLIRATQHGDAFEIYSAKNEEVTAVLVGAEVLRQQIVSPPKRRRLRDLVDSLPFKRWAAPRLHVELPDDESPRLRLPNK